MEEKGAFHEDESIQIPPEELFERVRVLVESGHYTSALTLLEIFEQFKGKRQFSYPTKGLLLSYLGLCVARAKKQYALGMDSCRRAAEMEVCYPDCWLNLGRLHLDYKQRKQAWKCFQKGLEMDPGFAPIQREMKRMGQRKPPPISMLSRDHFLNRFIGKLLQEGKRERVRREIDKARRKKPDVADGV